MPESPFLPARVEQLPYISLLPKASWDVTASKSSATKQTCDSGMSTYINCDDQDIYNSRRSSATDNNDRNKKSDLCNVADRTDTQEYREHLEQSRILEGFDSRILKANEKLDQLVIHSVNYSDHVGRVRANDQDDKAKGAHENWGLRDSEVKLFKEIPYMVRGLSAEKSLYLISSGSDNLIIMGEYQLAKLVRNNPSLLTNQNFRDMVLNAYVAMAHQRQAHHQTAWHTTLNPDTILQIRPGEAQSLAGAERTKAAIEKQSVSHLVSLANSAYHNEGLTEATPFFQKAIDQANSNYRRDEVAHMALFVDSIKRDAEIADKCLQGQDVQQLVEQRATSSKKEVDSAQKMTESRQQHQSLLINFAFAKIAGADQAMFVEGKHALIDLLNASPTFTSDIEYRQNCFNAFQGHYEKLGIAGDGITSSPPSTRTETDKQPPPNNAVSPKYQDIDLSKVFSAHEISDDKKLDAYLIDTLTTIGVIGFLAGSGLYASSRLAHRMRAAREAASDKTSADEKAQKNNSSNRDRSSNQELSALVKAAERASDPQEAQKLVLQIDRQNTEESTDALSEIARGNSVAAPYAVPCIAEVAGPKEAKVIAQLIRNGNFSKWWKEGKFDGDTVYSALADGNIPVAEMKILLSTTIAQMSDRPELQIALCKMVAAPSDESAPRFTRTLFPNEIRREAVIKLVELNPKDLEQHLHDLKFESDPDTRKAAVDAWEKFHYLQTDGDCGDGSKPRIKDAQIRDFLKAFSAIEWKEPPATLERYQKYTSEYKKLKSDLRTFSERASEYLSTTNSTAKMSNSQWFYTPEKEVSALLSGNPELLETFQKLRLEDKRLAGELSSLGSISQERCKDLKAELDKICDAAGLPRTEVYGLPMSNNGEAGCYPGRSEIEVAFKHVLVNGRPSPFLADCLIHELGHHEQADLVVRKILDDIGVNKSLTPQERSQAKELYRSKVVCSLEDNFLDTVLKSRDGHRLSDNAAKRAQLLCDSFQAEAKFRNRTAQQVCEIDLVIKDLQSGRPLDKALGNIHDQRLRQKLSRAILTETAGDKTSARNNTARTIKALESELSAVERRVFEQYRSTHHEVEAYNLSLRTNLTKEIMTAKGSGLAGTMLDTARHINDYSNRSESTLISDSLALTAQFDANCEQTRSGQAGLDRQINRYFSQANQFITDMPETVEGKRQQLESLVKQFTSEVGELAKNPMLKNTTVVVDPELKSGGKLVFTYGSETINPLYCDATNLQYRSTSGAMQSAPLDQVKVELRLAHNSLEIASQNSTSGRTRATEVAATVYHQLHQIDQLRTRQERAKAENIDLHTAGADSQACKQFLEREKGIADVSANFLQYSLNNQSLDGETRLHTMPVAFDTTKPIAGITGERVVTVMGIDGRMKIYVLDKNNGVTKLDADLSKKLVENAFDQLVTRIDDKIKEAKAKHDAAEEEKLATERTRILADKSRYTSDGEFARNVNHELASRAKGIRSGIGVGVTILFLITTVLEAYRKEHHGGSINLDAPIG